MMGSHKYCKHTVEFGAVASKDARARTPGRVRRLTRGVESCMIASKTSMEAAFELAKLDEGIRNITCDVGGRLTIKSLGLDQPSTNRRIS
jgi:hypothetical protein